MPYDDPDPHDPNMLVGVGLPCGDDEVEEMAAAFASELAQIGHDEERIVQIFRQPFYAGAHLAWSQLGEERVRGLISEAVSFWSHCRVTVQDGSPEGHFVPVETLRDSAGRVKPVARRRR